MEKLCNLEQLPPFGFTVACFPHKVKGACIIAMSVELRKMAEAARCRSAPYQVDF
jgi:hypothetical protein